MVSTTKRPLPRTPHTSIRLSELAIDDLYARPWGDDVTSLLSGVLGRPGMSWRSGRLTGWETHPDLSIRSGSQTPSKYWGVRNEPTVRGMLRRAASAVSGAPYRVVPGRLPAWLEDNEEAMRARDLQHTYIERLFWRWCQQGRAGWNGFVRDIVQTVPVEGWGWFEIVADTRTLEVDDLGTHTVLWPDTPPEWRAPWSVRYWIMENERPVGLVASFHNSTDWSGENGDSWCVIPAEKILRIASEQVGSNVYGESWLRPIYTHIEALRQLQTVEMVSKTINGVGEVFFKISEGVTVSEADGVKMDNYITNRHSAAAGGMRLPPGVEVERLDGEQVDHSALADRLMRQIGLAMNQEYRLMALQSVGSQAARGSANDDARSVFDDTIRELIAEPTEDLFSRLITHSFPDLAQIGWVFTPTLEWSDERPPTTSEHLDHLSKAVGAGLVTWTAKDEAAMRERLELEPRDVAEDEDGRTISADDLQGLRLAYTSGILHDPDFGNAIRKGYGVSEVSAESIAAYKSLVKGADGEAREVIEEPTPTDDTDEVPE